MNNLDKLTEATIKALTERLENEDEDDRQLAYSLGFKEDVLTGRWSCIVPGTEEAKRGALSQGFTYYVLGDAENGPSDDEFDNPSYKVYSKDLKKLLKFYNNITDSYMNNLYSEEGE